MGFFGKMMKNLGVISNVPDMGCVLAGDYVGYPVTYATFNGGKEAKMVLNILDKNQVDIAKADVKEFTIIEQNAKFSLKNELKIGTRYKVVLNSGKSFIVGIVATECSKFENLFLL